MTTLVWEIICWSALVVGLGAMWLARRWMRLATAKLDKALAVYEEAHGQARDARHLYGLASDICSTSDTTPNTGDER